MAEIARHEVDIDRAWAMAANYPSMRPVLIKNALVKPNRLTTLRDNAILYATANAAVQSSELDIARSLRTACEAMHAIFALSSDSELTVELDGVHQILQGPMDESCLGASRWIDSFYLSVVQRDTKAIDDLCLIDTAVLRQSSTRSPEFAYLYCDALKAFWKKETPLDLLRQAVDKSEPDQAKPPLQDYVDNIRVPEMQLLYHLICQDTAEFNDSLLWALERHKKYWTQKCNGVNPSGHLSFGCLAFAGLAYERDMPIDVHSDYIPPFLIRGFDRILRALDYNDSSTVESLRSHVPEDDLPLVIKAYWNYPDWERRYGVIRLVQDSLDPTLDPIMRDVLKAPDRTDDLQNLARAIALSHLQRDHRLTEKYFEDSELAKRDAQQWME